MSWWGGRTVPLWAAALFVVAFVAGNFGANGQCEYVSGPDGVAPPLGYPLEPQTTAGRLTLQKFISIMSMTDAFSSAVLGVLLGGLLWARAVRSPPSVWALILVPTRALLIKVASYSVHVFGPERTPEGYLPLVAEFAIFLNVLGADELRRASLWLIAGGLVALTVRSLVERCRVRAAGIKLRCSRRLRASIDQVELAGRVP